MGLICQKVKEKINKQKKYLQSPNHFSFLKESIKNLKINENYSHLFKIIGLLLNTKINF